MKRKLFMLISITMFMQSCGISQKEKEKATQDSILAVDHKRQLMIDSIAIKEQNIAIGDIKFGISSKEFDKKSKVLLKDLNSKLGEYRFEIVIPDFYHGGLYSVRFKGISAYPFEYDDIMPKQYNALYALLKSKYSEPTRSIGFQEASECSVGHSKRGDTKLSAWVIGNKRIDIYVYSFCDTSYSLDLEIINLNALDAINREYDKKEKLEKEKENQSIKKTAKIL